MNFEKFIQPKVVEIGGRKFTISMIPAIEALSINNAITKIIKDEGLIGVTMLPAAIDRAIISYTALSDGGVNIVPDTDQLFSDIFKCKMMDEKALVLEMVKYNFGFLITGDLLDKLAPEEATDSVS